MQNLHLYLGIDPNSVHSWIIVGAWHGTEVPELLDRYASCRFVLLEPSRPAFAELEHNLGSHPRCVCLEVAASAESGNQTLYETTVAGSSSLLPLGNRDDPRTFQPPGQEIFESYLVRTVRLDELDVLSDGPIDCLWIDVQGLELPVLEGAQGIIDRVRAAFIEVATDKVSYDGATKFADLYGWMAGQGFRLAGLGTDFANGQGNALWLRGW